VLRFVLARLSGLVIVMFLVATIVFVISRVIPGDPAAVMLGAAATAEDAARLKAPARPRRAPTAAIYPLDRPVAAG